MAKTPGEMILEAPQPSRMNLQHNLQVYGFVHNQQFESGSSTMPMEATLN